MFRDLYRSAPPTVAQTPEGLGHGAWFHNSRRRMAKPMIRTSLIIGAALLALVAPAQAGSTIPGQFRGDWCEFLPPTSIAGVTIYQQGRAFALPTMRRKCKCLLTASSPTAARPPAS